MMKKGFSYFTLLLFSAMTIVSCSTDDLPFVGKKQTWTVSGKGFTEDTEATRSLSIGGDDGITLFTNWQSDQIVALSSDGNKVGTLAVTPDAVNPSVVTIDGEITGEYEVGANLTYFTPSNVRVWTGQAGSIASISSGYNYQTATVSVTSVDENRKALTMSSAAFSRAEAIVRFRFKDPDGNRLKPSELTVMAGNDKLVQKIAEDGTIVYGDITVNTVQDDGEYPYDLFVALHNDDQVNSTSYTFLAKVDDQYYYGPTADWSSVLSDGRWVRVARVLKPVSLNTLTLSDNDVEVTAGGTADIIVSENTGGGELTVTSSDESVATVSLDGSTITIVGVAEGTTTVTIRSAATDSYAPSTKTISITVTAAPPAPEAVDLGIVVDGKNILFASMNVGATNEGDYGKFFAWGETKGYSSADVSDGRAFDWVHYKWNNSSDSKGNSLTKYNTNSNKGTVDNKTTLEPADDAAHANLGGDWYMPTREELQALYATKSNTTDYTWSWTTANGHNGYRITRNSTGKSIFLPATGVRGESSISSQGVGAYYWSSTLNTTNNSSDTRTAYTLLIMSNSAQVDDQNRCYGFPVRAVQRVSESTPAGLALADVTTDHIGYVIGTDGKVYENVDAAKDANTDACAIIAYVGSETAETGYTHGLAIAMKDANEGEKAVWKTTGGSNDNPNRYEDNWGGAVNAKESGSALSADRNTDTWPAFKAALTNSIIPEAGISAEAPATGTTGWFLPSIFQWNKIVNGMTNTTAIIGYVTAANSALKVTAFNEKITTAGGTALVGSSYADSYLSSSEYDKYNAYRYLAGAGAINKCDKTDAFLVRAALAF